jgi:hypothetical protein
VTWAEEIRPLLEQALRFVDREPIDWASVESATREALMTIPRPIVPFPLPLGRTLTVEAGPTAECREALNDCLDHISKREYSEAVNRLQDAWQHAERDEGL